MYNNEVSITGRLADAPQFITGTTPEQDRIASRITIPWNNGTMDFMPFVAWGATARAIRDHCRKGAVLMVQGVLRTHHSMTGKFYAEINARNVSFDQVESDQVMKRPIDRDQHKNFSQTMTQKEAYEHNKKLVNCIVCGKELHMHPSVGVKYCKCIEQLP